MNTVARAIVTEIKKMFRFIMFPENRDAVIRDIRIIFIYSAIKIKAKEALPYSILNPETSSDSPSAKSNGVRFVSAKFVMNHIINRGLNRIITHDFEKE